MFDATQPSADEALKGLCAAYLEALPISGAAVSVFGGSLAETLVCASDETSVRLDEIQYDLGDGPRWEVIRTQTPVLVPDLQETGDHSWPAFSKAATDIDAASLFVFPLLAGGLSVGIVEMYCSSPRELTDAQISLTTYLASRTAWTLLRRLMNEGEGGSIEVPLARREIHQATGMVLVQTGSTAAEALLLLRGHAFTSGRTLRETAADVVGRQLDFTPAAAPGVDGLQ
ncbi:GAF and ANTAR domain-containing protein [uncultured Arthrobacter sp.]|uniref:GAF and ANTAR domain-containing protein n=1 Tax=uncultured Arthrobacter sp. TaxID=114050 RepID=UPI00261F17CD|nr:GAF and ANTAR domain-containing protein [uncultured Arthrobacter sp.]